MQTKSRKVNIFVNNINTEFASLAGNEQKLEALEDGSQFHNHMLESPRTYIAKISNIDSNIFPPNKLDLANNLLSIN